MKRGEVWSQAGGPSYAGKPRPALIVQSDLLTETDAVAVSVPLARRTWRVSKMR